MVGCHSIRTFLFLFLPFHYQFLSILPLFGNGKVSVFTQFSKHHDQKLSLLTTFGRDDKIIVNPNAGNGSKINLIYTSEVKRNRFGIIYLSEKII